MRLTIPESKIKLYKDGFTGHDKLSRESTGDKLSELVERIDDPLVIALDGAWGSGKSFFLKCWVGEHLKREENTTQTVYFDAFKYDYLDDPLVALTGAIADRFRTPEDQQQEESEKRTQNLKKTAWAVSKAAGRIGLSAVTFGATEILSDLGDEIASAEGEEAKAFLNKETGNEQAEHFWDAHRAKMAAMEAFRLALIELTEPETNDSEERPAKKLVIVVDELDRCRPDFALSLLEVIKHFFNVDGVHFILGVNLNELRNSVIARYGNKSDAQTYLQKFVTLTLRLPDKNTYLQPIPIWVEHFQKASAQMEFPDRAKPLLDTTEVILQSLRTDRSVSLRDAERVLTILATIPRLEEGFNAIYLPSLATMAVFKAFLPDAYYKFRDDENASFQYSDYFEKDKILSTHIGGRVELIWRAIQNYSALTTEEKTGIGQIDFMVGETLFKNLLAKVTQDLLETFQFYDT